MCFGVFMYVVCVCACLNMCEGMLYIHFYTSQTYVKNMQCICNAVSIYRAFEMSAIRHVIIDHDRNDPEEQRLPHKMRQKLNFKQ